MRKLTTTHQHFILISVLHNNHSCIAARVSLISFSNGKVWNSAKKYRQFLAKPIPLARLGPRASPWGSVASSAVSGRLVPLVPLCIFCLHNIVTSVAPTVVTRPHSEPQAPCDLSCLLPGSTAPALTVYWPLSFWHQPPPLFSIAMFFAVAICESR